MKVIVVGCGKIGIHIISSLVSEGHDVVAVDSSLAAVDSITKIYDVMGVCGEGADYATLSEAGVEKAQLFIAVAGSDELNMLSCFVAKQMGAEHTIARIRNPHYNADSLGFMCSNLRLAMSINPELLAAHELFNILKLPAAAKIESFSRRNFEMIELILKAGSPMDGLRVLDIRNRFSAEFVICAVQRDSEIFIPDGNFVLRAGDKIAFTAAHTEIQKMLKEMGLFHKQAKKVMILGGSRTAYYLARMLTGVGNYVKIIEKEESVCNTLAESLPKAVIVHGDGASQELLMEEGLDSVDAFVSLTGLDEVNILMSIFASTHNVPKVIAKVNSDELSSIADNLGLDCITSPKKAISDVVIRYARALENSLGSNIETLYTFMDGRIEAIEFNVAADSELVNVPIAKLNIKRVILVAGILRNRKPIIPNGNDVFLPGDRVIVVSEPQHLSDLSEIVRD